MTTGNVGGSPPGGFSPFRISAPDSIDTSFACLAPRSCGEIIVVGNPGASGFTIAWRRDRRYRKKVVKLTTCRNNKIARTKAFKISRNYIPPYISERDYQKSAVYRWETNIADNWNISPVQAKVEVYEICRFFNVEPPHISVSNRVRSVSYFSASKGIILSSQMVDHATLRHELAHYLVWRMGIKEPSHGPVFTGTLLSIYGFYNSKALSRLIQEANAYNIDMNIDIAFGLLKRAAKLAA